MTEERAEEVLSAARKSVASQEDEDTGFALAYMAEKLLDLEEEIEGLKEQVGQMLEGEEGIEILCTIPGINRWSAAILRSEIGPIDRFDSAKELVAYVGLDPQREESGDREASRSISRRGNPRVRAILYTCVRNAVQHNPPVKALYDRLTDRGKHHMLGPPACENCCVSRTDAGARVKPSTRLTRSGSRSRKPKEMRIPVRRALKSDHST